MISCASIAIAAVAALPSAARAQVAPPTGAFQGSISSSTGSVVRTPTSNTQETITIGSSTATINWSPNDTTGTGNIDFLPAGNIATFTNDPLLTSNYTVLNRIIPTDTSRPIELNGQVISRITDGISTSTGGNVWFYSPGGIVIGANAVFDVGGLLLTTADLPTGFTADPNGFSASFSAPSGSTSAVRILDGAQINALQQGSYVAIVAPRVEQGGTVNVNGSAAYVAAEQATLTMNQGLFDIQVDVGTDDPNGIVHTGTTTGVGNATDSDHHGIYMVAVPKNNALTMLLQGGQVGFTDVQNATVANGEIILSAGYSVSHDLNNATVIDGLNLGGAIGGPSAGIDIEGGNFTSNLFGYATNAITATGGGGTLAFAHDVSLQGISGSSLIANDGDTITVGGDANISADDLRYFIGTNEGDSVDAHGGVAIIEAYTGGSLTIDGNATVTANSSPTVNLVTNYGGTSNAGFAMIDADGGSISVGGAASIQAIAFGDTVDNGLDGRDSFGGFAILSTSNGGSIGIGGTLGIIADGDGSYSALASGGTGGTGYGGTAEIVADSNGSINVSGTTAVTANGIGGLLISSPDGTGGLGSGGDVYIGATNGGSLAFASDAQFAASGYGAISPAQGGEGDGGSAELFIDGGSVTGGGIFQLFADGYGGNGMTAGAGFGGFATGEIGGGEGASAGGTLNVTGEFRLQAGGHGGYGLNNPGGAGGAAGDGYGGSSYFYVTNFLQPDATINVQLGIVAVAANGEGGLGGSGLIGGAGGNGFAGEAITELYGGNISTGDLQTFATARGGAGGAGTAGVGGAGGNAYGGYSSVTIGTDVTASTVYSYDRAFAGDGGVGTTVDGDGGSAFGGSAAIDILAGATLNGDADIAVSAVGGNGGNGGDGDGGDGTLTVQGTLNAGYVSVDSSGTGGNGNSGLGGYSGGGSSDFVIDGGAASVVNGITIAAVGNADLTGDGVPDGGFGAAGGGDAGGGSAILEITANGGSLTAGGDTVVTARAIAGNGGTGSGGVGGSGGSGEGGYASFIVSPGATVSIASLALNANGLGGAGGNSLTGGLGGDGNGGTVDLEIDGGTFTALDIADSAQGFGGTGGTGSSGNGGAGGAGYGGSSHLTVGGNLQAASYFGVAHGWGGVGGTGAAQAGDGGDGTGGYVSADIQSNATADFAGGGDPNLAGVFRISAAGIGGDGFNGGDGFAGGSDLSVEGSMNATVRVQSTGQAQGGTGWGGLGGNGNAGEGWATLTITGSLDTPQLLVGSGGFAGSGATGMGVAQGGSATLTADGGSLSLTGSGSEVEADATDINDGNPAGNAGSATISSVNGGSITAQDLTVSTQGNDGAGSTTISTGTGGTISATDLTLISGGDLNVPTIGTDITVSDKLDLETGGNLTFADVTTGTLKFDATGDVMGGDINVSDHVSGKAQGAITLGAITAGPGLPTNEEGFSVGIVSATSITTGDVSAVGSVGFATLGGLTTGNITAGDLFLAMVSSDISTGSVTTASTGRVYLADSSMFINAGGPDNFDPSLVLALDPVATGGAITINGPLTTGQIQAAAGTGLSLGSVSASQSIELSAGGDLAASDISAGSAVTASAGGNVTTGDISSGGDMNLAAGSDLNTGDLSAAGVLTAAAGGNLTTGDISSDPAISLVAGGDLITGNVTSDDVISLIAGGDLTTANLAAAALNAFAGGNLSVADVNSSGNAQFTAGGLASFLGIVSAPTITVTSGDIDIADGASLGAQGITNLIILNAINNTVILGGSETDAGAYHLSEDGEISSDALVFNAVGTGEGIPNVTVHDVQIEGSQTDGHGVGTVTLNTDGTVTIDGMVNFINAGPTDSLTINAGQAIEIITDTGGIIMTATGGQLAGTLELTAHDIWVADQSVMDQLNADPNFAGRDQALATNDGAVNAAGYIQAGAIDVTMLGSSFLVQNSGTSTDLGGLSVGDGGLTIVNEGSDPATVIVNGRQVTSGGTIVGGDAFADEVTPTGAGGFSSDSSVNGCPLSGCAPIVPPPPPPPPAPPPQVVGAESILGPIGMGSTSQSADEQASQEDQEDKDKKEADNEAGVDPSVYLINTGPLRIEQTIDEPITSGNDGPGGPH